MKRMVKRLILICLFLIPGIALGQSAAVKYIEQYKQDAIQKMNEYGIPASIILGVAMHESGSGTSKISKYLNNHFGMKGKNESRRIRSSYKGYDDASASYEDFILFLKNRVQFNKLFDQYGAQDYKGWAKGIQRGGYAHSKSWSKQVLAIIDKYELYQYDAPSDDPTLSPSVVLAQASPPAVPVAATPDPPEKEHEPAVYRVKKGDTLGKIAKKFKTTVAKIRISNKLKSNNLRIGQKLTLESL